MKIGDCIENVLMLLYLKESNNMFRERLQPKPGILLDQRFHEILYNNEVISRSFVNRVGNRIKDMIELVNMIREAIH